MRAEADFDILRSAALNGCAHGFFGSRGKAHQFGFGGPGAPGEIRALRAQAAAALASDAAIIAPHQTHSSEVLTVENGWEDTPEGRPQGDGVVTASPGLAIGVVTADCAPVLFADREAGVIGAAHAGWRGAMGGVLENTCAAMERLGADTARIAAAIGPTIAQQSYEVDAPFRTHFEPGDNPCFISAPPREGQERWLFDLPRYVSRRLERIGLAAIQDCGEDTFSQPTRFFSYRRAQQHGLANYGRQISLITLSHNMPSA